MTENHIYKLVSEGTFQGEALNGKLIETHISWVIISKTFAFKIKKTMQYSFLDFSSLAKRKFYCERELLLNQRWSSIYLSVQPVKINAHNIFIGKGKGRVIDYAVCMKKLRESKRMDHILNQGKLTLEHLNILAHKIVSFHKTAEIIHTPFNKKKAKKDFNDISSISNLVGNQLGNKFVHLIQNAIEFSDNFLDNNTSTIKQRIKSGYQRDVHGDLYSKNIFVYKDPVIFDCIEFNDSFRQIDLINELAFFCMDLESWDKWEMSQFFIGKYLEQSPIIRNPAERDLFVYYKTYRANVRAKVNALRAAQALNKKDEQRNMKDVKRYLLLMDNYI